MDHSCGGGHPNHPTSCQLKKIGAVACPFQLLQVKTPDNQPTVLQTTNYQPTEIQTVEDDDDSHTPSIACNCNSCGEFFHNLQEELVSFQLDSNISLSGLTFISQQVATMRTTSVRRTLPCASAATWWLSPGLLSATVVKTSSADPRVSPLGRVNTAWRLARATRTRTMIHTAFDPNTRPVLSCSSCSCPGHDVKLPLLSWAMTETAPPGSPVQSSSCWVRPSQSWARQENCPPGLVPCISSVLQEFFI